MAYCIWGGIAVSFLLYFITMIILKIHYKKTLPPYIILTAKNSQDSIEGIIRTYISVLKKCGPSDFTEIIVLDMGSDDQTLTILNKLSKNYPFVKITSG